MRREDLLATIAIADDEDERCQDELIANLFHESNFSEEKINEEFANSSFILSQVADDTTDPIIDDDIQQMVRQDVRKMMNKIKTKQNHKKSQEPVLDPVEEVNVENPGKYGEAQDELFKQIKKEKIKKRKTSSSRKKASRTVGNQKSKKGYYKNFPKIGPEHIDVSKYSDANKAAELSVHTTAAEETTRAPEGAPSDPVDLKPSNSILEEPRMTPVNHSPAKRNENTEKSLATELRQETTTPMTDDTKPIPQISNKRDGPAEYEKGGSETVELVLLDNSDKFRELEQENRRLRDTLNFLQQTAMDKERYYAELAWFGKRSEDEVIRIRPNFWEERSEDLGPEIFEEFKADAQRISDPDVGDWEHGFASGSLAMARLLLGLSHAVRDEKICSFHEANQDCTEDCVKYTVEEQRRRELEDFPVLDP